MAIVQPFQAVRPTRNKVCLVPSYSYERYGQLDINRIIKYNPYSFLNIIAKPYVRHLEAGKRYQAIKKFYQKFKKKEVFVQESIPSFYLLRISDENGMSFTGLTALASTWDYAEGIIKRHEKTLTNRVKLFTDYLYNVRINAEPVLLAHEPVTDLDLIYEKLTENLPEYEFSMPDGKVFEMWPVSDVEIIKRIQGVFEQMNALYIADGHHRVESSYRLMKKMKSENPYHSGMEAYNFFMTFLIDYKKLKIYPFNRGIKDFGNIDKETFLQNLASVFEIQPLNRYFPPKKHEVILFLCNEYYRLIFPENLLQNGRTDVEILNEQVFKNILGIKNMQNTPRITYCEGKTNIKCLTKKINKGECKAGFFMHELDFEEIKAKADAGETLPPKSSYIEPKLLSGLFVYEF